MSLRLESAKSRAMLGWRPLIELNQAITWTIDWYKAFQRRADVRSVTLAQIGATLNGTTQT
jgi:CDP-glucose 4,6-dehydratase